MSLQEAKMTSLKDKLNGKPIETILDPEEEKPQKIKKSKKKEKQ